MEASVAETAPESSMGASVAETTPESSMRASAAKSTAESSAGIAVGSAEAAAVPEITPVLAAIALALGRPIGVGESMKAIARDDLARLGGWTVQEEHRCQGRGDARLLNAGKLDTHRRHPFHAPAVLRAGAYWLSFSKHALRSNRDAKPTVPFRDKGARAA
jgi:hypothetical protein